MQLLVNKVYSWSFLLFAKTLFQSGLLDVLDDEFLELEVVCVGGAGGGGGAHELDQRHHRPQQRPAPPRVISPQQRRVDVNFFAHANYRKQPSTSMCINHNRDNLDIYLSKLSKYLDILLNNIKVCLIDFLQLQQI